MWAVQQGWSLSPMQGGGTLLLFWPLWPRSAEECLGCSITAFLEPAHEEPIEPGDKSYECSDYADERDQRRETMGVDSVRCPHDNGACENPETKDAEHPAQPHFG